MSSETKTNQSLRLPVIDFSAPQLKPNTTEWESVKAQVQQALIEFGSFEASFGKLPLNVKKEVYESIKEYFDLPLETKKLSVSSKPFFGYSNGDKYSLPFEAVNIDEASILEKVESFAKIPWPEGNPSFCKTVKAYTDHISELDLMIGRMIFEILGIEKYLEEHLESFKNYSIRITKYEDPENIGTKVALGDHTDIGLINILSQNDIDGLEIQTKDGQWIPAKPTPRSFVVILGEVFASVLANGRLHCPVHRVMLHGNKPRYSIAFFSHPEDYLCKTPEELVDEEHPLMFKPFSFNQYFTYCATADRTRATSTLRDFCGI